MKESRRPRSRKEQFEHACKRLEHIISLNRPHSNFAVHRIAIGTVFLLQNFDPERAKDILKKVYFLHHQEQTDEISYIQRS